MTIVLGGESFKTQKAIRDRASRIMHATRLGADVEGVDLAFVLDLLARHCESDQKIGCGVASIQVENAPGWSNRCFWITRLDGTRTDFGIQSCLKPASHEQNVRSAMRTEVADQVAAFRREAFSRGPVRCAVTDVDLTDALAHVDHAKPWTFVALAQEFLEGRDVADIKLLGQGDGDTVLTLADRELAARWHAFHAERAVLRVVSAAANLGVLRRGPR